MKRMYASTTVRANGVEIKVRQVVGFGNRQVPRNMTRIAAAAQSWLQACLAETKTRDMRPGVTAAYQKCFLHTPGPISINAVRSTLWTTLNGLRAAHSVKVRNDDDAYGYVKSYYGGRRHLINGVRAFDEDGDQVARKGDIHLDTSTVKNDLPMAVITYIHEATHRFANTNDYDQRGYFRSDGTDFESPGLTAFQAVLNADSYAYYVHKTMIALHGQVII